MQPAHVKNWNFPPATAFRRPVLRHSRVNFAAVSVLAVKRIAVLLLCFPFAVVAASNLDNAAALALSPYDQTVVIQLPDAEMQALKVGQALEGIDAVLVDVLDDRAVFEEVVINDNGTKTKGTVWIYKAENGVSRVQRLSRQAPEAPVQEVTRVIGSESKMNSATTK